MKMNKLNNKTKFNNRNKMNFIYQNLIILNKNCKIDFFHPKLKIVRFSMIRPETITKRKIWQIFYHLINLKIITIFPIF